MPPWRTWGMCASAQYLTVSSGLCHPARHSERADGTGDCGVAGACAATIWKGPIVPLIPAASRFHLEPAQATEQIPRHVFRELRSKRRQCDGSVWRWWMRRPSWRSPAARRSGSRFQCCPTAFGKYWASTASNARYSGVERGGRHHGGRPANSVCPPTNPLERQRRTAER